ncbi:hypothetical protein ACMU_11545 [Actibacterium mucosum KCTC 23349]|uniref:DUF3572 domain-containing protein n=1 Tax=Actibacterium mucosum KCTC 23349 TaxID=1454373 RepID=A0A037ZI89_9RHOB|nr:DUF3572 domain-containing protein [Actibacterium mucosum]KAJ55324.1 hypothetical protein ACMU_11545 [Actibacterium mucosum KCTC 23349]
MKQVQAETFALQALSWLVANDELLPVFLGASGLSSDDLRARAGEAEFLVSVLDFLSMDDAWVIALCADLGHPNTAVQEARFALPGGEQVHWT